MKKICITASKNDDCNLASALSLRALMIINSIHMMHGNVKDFLFQCDHKYNFTDCHYAKIIDNHFNEFLFHFDYVEQEHYMHLKYICIFKFMKQY